MTRLPMMRDALRARIQPAIDQLVDQVVDMLVDRIEQHLNQLELAFDATTSAFASDLSVTDGAARRNDVRGKGRVDRAAAQPRSRRVDDSDQSPRSAQVDTGSGAAAAASADTKPLSDRALQQGQDLPPSTSSTSAESAVEESPRPTKRSQGAATPGQSASSAAGNVAESHRAPSRSRGSDSAVVDASRRPCGCAARGRHRRDCSTNISTSRASALPALTPPSSPATSPTPITDKRDRLAALKERQRQREREEHPPVLPQPAATFELKGAPR